MTLAEVLVASAITVTLMGTVVGMTGPLQRLFDTQPEYGDMHQRLRGAIEALTSDLVGAAPPVMPYRAGIRRHDPSEGVFYRTDAITLVPTTWDPGATSHTYYLKDDPATGVAHLMRYDGGESDLPLADHITRLEFRTLARARRRWRPNCFRMVPGFRMIAIETGSTWISSGFAVFA